MNSGGSFGGWSDPGPQEPATEQPAAGPLDLPDGDRYERIDLLGVGGMGRVYEAYDLKLQRTVALKEVAPHLAHGPAAARLAVEAMLTADLDHPGIVSVHDAGRTDDGRLYYTMRLVRGESMADRLERAETPADRAVLLRHLLDVCHAVGYAHRRGVVHRDLKPANVVLGAFGETQVVDWGLARRLADTSPDVGSAGTEGYMSPESAAGSPGTTRSDVFSLGATLRQVAGEDAAPDLLAIIGRAEHPDPAQRYADAHELAVDLERFLDGRRVSAYDYSTVELLKRVISAWRAPLAVAAAAAVVLAGVGVSAWVSTTRARDRAISAEGQTRAALDASDRNLAASLEAQAIAALRAGRLPEAEVLAARSLVTRESPVARGVLIAGASSARPSLLSHTDLPPCAQIRLGPDHLLCFQGDSFGVWGPEMTRLWGIDERVDTAVVAGDHLVLIRPHLLMEVRALATGELLASIPDAPGAGGLTAGADGAVAGISNGSESLLVHLPSLRVERAVPCSDSSPAISFAVHAARAFVMCRGAELRVIEGGTVRSLGAELLPTQEPAVLAAAGDALLAGTVRGAVLVLDAETGALRAEHEVADTFIDRIVPIRGTGLVAVGAGRQGLQLWDFAGGHSLLRLPAPTRAAAVDPLGRLRVAGDDLRVWELPAQPRPRRFGVPTGLASLSVSGDGGWLAVGQGDGTITIRATGDGQVVVDRRWQERVAKWVEFTGDGRQLVASTLGDTSVRSWAVDTWEERTLAMGGLCRRHGELADGRRWCAGYGRGISLVGAARSDTMELDSPVFDGDTAKSGRFAVWLGEGGTVWRIDRDAEAAPAFSRAGARGIAVDERGRVALAFERHVELTDAAGATLAILSLDSRGITDVAMSPNGQWIAVGALDGSTRLFSGENGRLVASLVGHAERVGAMDFTGDSATLFTGDWAGVSLRWDLAAADVFADQLLESVESGWRLDLETALAAAL